MMKHIDVYVNVFNVLVNVFNVLFNVIEAFQYRLRSYFLSCAIRPVSVKRSNESNDHIETHQ